MRSLSSELSRILHTHGSVDETVMTVWLGQLVLHVRSTADERAKTLLGRYLMSLFGCPEDEVWHVAEKWALELLS